jgi:hypothetical protein
MTLALATIESCRLALLLFPCVLALVLGLTVFWIGMLVDCAKRIGAGDNRQIAWLIAIALTQVLGALAYLLFGRTCRQTLSS